MIIILPDELYGPVTDVFVLTDNSHPRDMSNEFKVDSRTLSKFISQVKNGNFDSFLLDEDL